MHKIAFVFRKSKKWRKSIFTSYSATLNNIMEKLFAIPDFDIWTLYTDCSFLEKTIQNKPPAGLNFDGEREKHWFFNIYE